MRRRATAAIAAIALCAACASARTGGEVDAGGGDGDQLVDATAQDADDELDAAAIDAPGIDAPAIDAAVIDARIDAPIDAPPPIDAAIDAPACTPTWHELLGNGGFDTAVAPWTQTSVILRTAAMMPFAPQAGTHAALFGASNNANDVLVQTVAIPAGATSVRVRGFQCHVTEDPISDTDTFAVTLETPAGNVLETLLDITNSDVAPVCLWLPFTWTATSGHPGETIVLRLRGRTNLAFLTRFAVDTLSLEWLGCP